MIQARWNNLPMASRNGLIRSYRAVLTDTVSGEHLSQNVTIRQVTFSNLVPHRTYRCKVAAYTVALGPFSNEIQVTTLPDGKLVLPCVTLETSSIPKLTNSCTESSTLNNDWYTTSLPL